MSKIGDWIKGVGAGIGGGITKIVDKSLDIASFGADALGLDSVAGVLDSVSDKFDKVSDRFTDSAAGFFSGSSNSGKGGLMDSIEQEVSTKIGKTVAGKTDSTKNALSNSNAVTTTNGVTRGSQGSAGSAGNTKSGETKTDQTTPKPTEIALVDKVKNFVLNNKIAVAIGGAVVAAMVAYFVWKNQTKGKLSAAKMAALAKARRARAAKAKSKPTARRK